MQPRMPSARRAGRAVVNAIAAVPGSRRARSGPYWNTF